MRVINHASEMPKLTEPTLQLVKDLGVGRVFIRSGTVYVVSVTSNGNRRCIFSPTNCVVYDLTPDMPYDRLLPDATFVTNA